MQIIIVMLLNLVLWVAPPALVVIYIVYYLKNKSLQGIMSAYPWIKYLIGIVIFLLVVSLIGLFTLNGLGDNF